MAKQVAPIGPLDSEVESEIKKCEQNIERLRRLQRTNEGEYDEVIEKMQRIALEGRSDSDVTPAMAEAILLEFEEVNPISSSRKDLEALLAANAEEECLGNSEIFVPYEEAVQNGEIPRDKL